MKPSVLYLKIASVILALFVMTVNADVGPTGSYGKGMLLGQAGIGLGFYGSVYGNTSIPPLNVLVEYGVHDLISIGGGLGIAGSGYDYYLGGYHLKYTYTYVPIMFRGAFHPFNLPALVNKIPMRDKWDAYGGLTLGWSIVHSSESTPPGFTGGSTYSTGESYFVPGLLLGTRYFFNNNFGAYLEEGSGFGWFNIGLVYKIK